MAWEIDITSSEVYQPLDENGNPAGTPQLMVGYRILDDKGDVVKDSSWSFQGSNPPTMEQLIEKYIAPEARMLKQMRKTDERLKKDAVPDGVRFRVE